MNAPVKDKNLNADGGSGTRIVVWLLGLFLILTIANLYLGFRSSNNVLSWSSNAEDLRVTSQQVAKNATEAAEGNLDAFRQLKASKERFDKLLESLNSKQGQNPVTQIDETPASIRNKEMGQILATWNEVSDQAEIIIENEDVVTGLYDIQTELSATIPQMQFLYQTVNDILLDSGASGEQTYFASRQMLFAERLNRSFQKVLQGGEDALVAAENFGTDVETFGEYLNAQLNGDAMLDVKRITNADARKDLEEIANLYVTVKEHVTKVISSTDTLFKVQQASTQIFDQSNKLLEQAELLANAYRSYGQRVEVGSGHYWYSIAGGALVLIFLIALGLQIRSSDRQRESRTRSQAEREREQNERNQQAIIRLLDEMEGLADGDLTANATVTEDFTGAIADAMNYTIDQLRSLVSTINDSVAKLSNATEETQGISNELAQASKNQAQEITGASAAINEMAVSIEQVSANAAESSQVAEKSVDIAKKGAEVVRNTIRGMDTIREQIQETSKRIKRLGESSQEIGDIVSLINDISDQTNILALNAAIQASMAGEAGRGFAVVADEVQRLAERSGNATKQIEALVKTIQTDTNEAVISMEASTAEVVRGARLAQDAGVALEEIERVSSSLAELIQNISNAARQQAASAGHVSNTMNVIQEITNQTLQGTLNTASSIGKLAELADELNSSVAGFKLPTY
ncbi:methyl-accepting chemotaxis protein [Pleionea sp. CnH1-48]|uniref:methyl-accepting chemotaxis protein n=1 Tax=Pleionea sp. CnH1-48 TaxID=2954494 RepID=UPI002096F94E|nr:methyl-accepting chemotaxis protein [Pleionea sp. CnH1-48]MCO7225253.1 methyl-accepting chemotaxis protein [Pleionea sp. CnH1-48]